MKKLSLMDRGKFTVIFILFLQYFQFLTLNTYPLLVELMKAGLILNHLILTVVLLVVGDFTLSVGILALR